MVFLSSFDHINQNFYEKGLMHSHKFIPQNWLKISKDDRQKISHEGEKQIKRIEVLIQSMTPEERKEDLSPQQ